MASDALLAMRRYYRLLEENKRIKFDKNERAAVIDQFDEGTVLTDPIGFKPVDLDDALELTVQQRAIDWPLYFFNEALESLAADANSELPDIEKYHNGIGLLRQITSWETAKPQLANPEQYMSEKLRLALCEYMHEGGVYGPWHVELSEFKPPTVFLLLHERQIHRYEFDCITGFSRKYVHVTSSKTWVLEEEEALHRWANIRRLNGELNELKKETRAIGVMIDSEYDCLRFLEEQRLSKSQKK